MTTHLMSTEVTPSLTPSELSLELRTGNSDSMQRRRKVVGLSLVAAINSMPFGRPLLADMLGAIDFIKTNDYPARGEA